MLWPAVGQDVRERGVRFFYDYKCFGRVQSARESLRDASRVLRWKKCKRKLGERIKRRKRRCNRFGN